MQQANFSGSTGGDSPSPHPLPPQPQLAETLKSLIKSWGEFWVHKAAIKKNMCKKESGNMCKKVILVDFYLLTFNFSLTINF